MNARRISPATLAHVKAAWPELQKLFEDDLADVHGRLEHAASLEVVRPLQARAAALNAFIKLPEDLEHQMRLHAEADRLGQAMKEPAP